MRLPAIEPPPHRMRLPQVGTASLMRWALPGGSSCRPSPWAEAGGQREGRIQGALNLTTAPHSQPTRSRAVPRAPLP
jgi:hypothetical protein